jgi:dTMP kinase
LADRRGTGLSVVARPSPNLGDVSGRGRFIVFEGGEGSGKSTQAHLLSKRIDALLTREPGGTRLGEVLRPLMLDSAAGPISARSELLLMVADRAQHCHELIVPTLDSGRDVVCDRFSGSTIAYQGFGRGIPLEEVVAACDLATGGLEADLTILLDVALEESARRRSRSLDSIESAGGEFHERVRAGFLTIAQERPSWVVVDASAEIDEVASRVLDVANERLGPFLP